MGPTSTKSAWARSAVLETRLAVARIDVMSTQADEEIRYGSVPWRGTGRRASKTRSRSPPRSLASTTSPRPYGASMRSPLEAAERVCVLGAGTTQVHSRTRIRSAARTPCFYHGESSRSSAKFGKFALNAVDPAAPDAARGCSAGVGESRRRGRARDPPSDLGQPACGPISPVEPGRTHQERMPR